MDTTQKVFMPLWAHPSIPQSLCRAQGYELHQSQSSSLKKVQVTGHGRDNAMEHLAALASSLTRVLSTFSRNLSIRMSVRCLLVTWSASHDVYEELAGVAHGHAEGLAGCCEFGGHWCQVSAWGRTWCGSCRRSVRWVLALWKSAVGAVDTVLTRGGCWALTRCLLSFFSLTTTTAWLCLQRTSLITTAVWTAAATPYKWGKKETRKEEHK